MTETTASLLTRLAAERPTLYALMGEMARRLLEKGHDYSLNDPEGLDNLLECEKIGTPGWKGAIIRKGDKWARIRLYAAREILHDKQDSFEDDLIDDANYDLLTVLLHRRAREAARKPEPLTPPLTGTATWPQRAQEVYTRAGISDEEIKEGFEPTNTTTWPLKEVRSGLAGLSIDCAEEVLHADEYGVLTVRPAVPTPTERR